MNKIKLEVAALIDKFEQHDLLKDHLLDLIKRADNQVEEKIDKNPPPILVSP